jgi:hypothetical protein
MQDKHCFYILKNEKLISNYGIFKYNIFIQNMDIL